MNSSLISELLSNHYTVALVGQLGHWNMAGVRFSELHDLTGQLYEEFIEKVDEVTEQLLSHEDVEVDFEIVGRLENSGTPEECLSHVLSEISGYVDFIYRVLENEEELSPEDEDTLVSLLHFVDLWRWKLQRNLQ